MNLVCREHLQPVNAKGKGCPQCTEDRDKREQKKQEAKRARQARREEVASGVVREREEV